MRLTRDDLPTAIALQPRVSDMITRFQVLAEDSLGLVRVVTDYRGIPNNTALGVLDLDRSRVSGWKRCDVGDQLRFIKKASFLVGEHAIIGKMFFPRRLIAGHQRIVQLLSPSDQFVLRNGNVCGGNNGCSEQKFDERELHKKG